MTNKRKREILDLHQYKTEAELKDMLKLVDVTARNMPYRKKRNAFETEVMYELKVLLDLLKTIDEVKAKNAL